MIRVLTMLAFVCVCLLALTVSPSMAYQQNGPRDSDSRPERRDKHRFNRYPAPPQSYYQHGWYQRPYPFHLDYYRMQYGGSYAPYFGNLYGPPRFYNFGPNFGPNMSPYGGAWFW